MALTDRQKKIAIKAYDEHIGDSGHYVETFAAVEAVLVDQDERIHNALNAEQGLTTEQKNALANHRWEQMKLRPGCAVCGEPITVTDPTATMCEKYRRAAEQGQATWKERCDQSEREYFARQQPAQPTHEHCMRLVDHGSDERLCSAPGCHYRTGSVSSCICHNGGDSWMRCPDHKPAQQPQGVCKNRSTEEGRKFWDHVEAVAEQTDKAPTYKLPSTHSDPAYMKCSFCGAIVIDKVLHTKWHSALKSGKQ